MRIAFFALRVIIPGACALAHAAIGQTVDFNNARTFLTVADRRVYTPVGVPLVGTNFVAQLWYGANALSLQPAGAPVPFRNVPPTDPLAGTWLGATRVLTGFTGGDTVVLRVRVWDSNTGATWETASASMQSPTFNYTIPIAPAAPSDYFIENFPGIRPLTFPNPGLLSIVHTNGGMSISFVPDAFAAFQVSSNLVDWTTLPTPGPPYVDPEAGTLSRRFYRLNRFGVISLNYVGFYRLNFAPRFTFFANQLHGADNRIVSLFPNPPEGTVVYWFKPETGGFNWVAYLGGAWEGDDVEMELTPGMGAILDTRTAFTHTFTGEIRFNNTNDLPAGFSLVSSAVPRSAPLNGPGGLDYPVANGDEVYRFDRNTGGYGGVNAYLGGAWEGDGEGEPPVPRVGEGFWLRKVAPAQWIQRINPYSPP
jgi:hypothetical protein